jgi:hypothetical protein
MNPATCDPRLLPGIAACDAEGRVINGGSTNLDNHLGGVLCQKKVMIY